MLTVSTVLLVALSWPPVVEPPTEPVAIAQVTTAALPTLLAAEPQEPQKDGEKAPDQADAKKPATPPHTGIHTLLDGLKEDVRHLPSKPNLYLAVPMTRVSRTPPRTATFART